MSIRDLPDYGRFQCAILVLVALLSSGVEAGISNFQNYPEGTSFGHNSFTDPASGITFTDLSGQGLGIETAAGNADYPHIVGNFLNSGGFVPGPLWSALPGFSFTATFPQLAMQSSLDGAYFFPGVPANIQVQWRGATGAVLGTENYSPNAGLPNPAFFSFSTLTPQIQSATVSGPAIGTLWTNVSFSTSSATASVPLPSALPSAAATMAVIGLIGWVRRLGLKRWVQ